MAETGPPDRQVAAAQAAALYAQLPLTVAVSVVSSVMLVLAVSGGMPPGGMLAWLAVMQIVALGRVGLWRAYRRDPDAAGRPGHWTRAAVAGALLAGASWGVGGALLWPDSEVGRLIWVFVVGGMCIGAAALHHASLGAVLAFMLPASLPIALRYAAEGTAEGIAAGTMILVFLSGLAVAARRFSQQFETFARLRLDLQRQSEELAAARAGLQREIEEHRATTATLHQSQKMEALGQLTGGVAHDFNNLLAGMMGSLVQLRRRLPPDDAQALLLLDGALAGGDRGAALTQRLLAFSRRQELRPETVDLAALLDGMAELLRRSVGPPWRVLLRVPPGLPPALVDPAQLELALLNLVINARDATPDAGEILVTLREEPAAAPGDGLEPGSHLVLSVIDRGIGMDAATLARAAEPFFTTKEPGKGTGLGLSMVYGLAEQSQGRLVLTSRPGEGTTAELWLRRAAVAALPRPAGDAAAPSAAARRLTVLVVDDDPLVLAGTAGMLEQLGHEVVQADGPRAAIEAVQAGRPVDLLVTDYGMPGMSGLDLAEALRRLRPGLPVILATGHGDLPAVPPGDVTPLGKPFRHEGLRAAIERALARQG